MLFTKNFLAVSRIAEAIFENLPSDEAAAFLAAFSDAIESDGKDFSLVCWQFLAAELRSLPPVEPEVQAAIDTVIKGMDLLAEGKEWPEEDARAAYWAAYAAAEATRPAPQASSAADCAASAAAVRAAASAAYWVAAISAAASAAYWASSANRAADWVAASAAKVAVFRRQRDLLLKLIKEAPITRSVGVSSVVLLVNETHD